MPALMPHCGDHDGSRHPTSPRRQGCHDRRFPAPSRPGAYLDKDKRKLILKTALELGYRPNALAASLNGGRSNLVGIVTGALRNPYDSDILAQLLARSQ